MTFLTRRNKIVFAIGIALAAGGFVWQSATHPAVSATTNKPKAALAVTLTQLETADWPSLLTVNGDIAAWQEAVVGAEAGGLQLVEVLVNVGEHVRKGQLLARLQSNTLGADLDQTRASLQEAEAALEEAAGNAERARRLQETGALSAQQISQLLTGEKTAQARVAVLKARLKADELRLSQTKIVAPDDGTISARPATIGAVVQNGQELFRLIRNDRLEWRASVASADLGRIKTGMKASIYAANGQVLRGAVRSIAPTVDTTSRNGLVYVDLAPGQAAKAGMFARGELDLGRIAAQTLPQAAVQMRDGFHYVYRLESDSKISEVKIKVGQRLDDRIQVLSGLKAGEKVVAGGVGFLSDGDTVRVVPAPNAEKAAASNAATKAQ